MSKEHVVVAGASAAGLAAADGLREGGFTGQITVLGAELHQPYDRPMLSKSLLTAGGRRDPVPLRSPQVLAQRGIELRLGHAAMGLDIDRRMVVTSDGDALPYDAVVIATGAAPRPLRTSGGEPVPGLRDLDDLARIRALIASAGKVTHVGAGFTGLELASALMSHGIGVTLLSAHELPLADCLGETAAGVLREQHLAHGVDLRGGAEVRGVSANTRGGYDIQFGDGTTSHAEVVLTNIGAQPCTGWLAESGVPLGGPVPDSTVLGSAIAGGAGLGRGVLCDPAGRSAVPGIWAAGDAAHVRDPLTDRWHRGGHWTDAVERGRLAGLNIARGTAVPYACVSYLWTEQYGRTIHLLGERRPGDREIVVANGEINPSFLILHGGTDAEPHADGERLHAVTACGHDGELRGYRKLLRAGASLGEALALARA
jgi:3-phenylpropionate/trans-cinnamate dioxygenase ferredoxin reductase subunit